MTFSRSSNKIRFPLQRLTTNSENSIKSDLSKNKSSSFYLFIFVMKIFWEFQLDDLNDDFGQRDHVLHIAIASVLLGSLKQVKAGILHRLDRRRQEQCLQKRQPVPAVPERHWTRVAKVARVVDVNRLADRSQLEKLIFRSERFQKSFIASPPVRPPFRLTQKSPDGISIKH